MNIMSFTFGIILLNVFGSSTNTDVPETEKKKRFFEVSYHSIGLVGFICYFI